MKNEQFDIETLNLIRNKLDYIYSIANTNYNDNPELMDTIENLTSIANIFANVKIQELKGTVETASPQGLIVSRLGNSYGRMKQYEKDRESQFPTWKI